MSRGRSRGRGRTSRATIPRRSPLDIVRLSFAAPECAHQRRSRGAPAIAAALGVRRQRAAIAHAASARASTRGARTCCAPTVADDRLAAAIFGQPPDGARSITALLAPGRSRRSPGSRPIPPSSTTLLKHPGTAAAFARSIHVRDGAVVTPGERRGRSVDQAIVGADPRRPAVVHREAARRARRPAWRVLRRRRAPRCRAPAVRARRAGDRRTGSTARAGLLDAVDTRVVPAGGSTSYPFMRADVDVAAAASGRSRSTTRRDRGRRHRRASGRASSASATGRRTAASTPRGSPRPCSKPAARPGARLDTFLFAQRALASERRAAAGDRSPRCDDFRALSRADADARDQRRARARRPIAAAGRAAAAARPVTTRRWPCSRAALAIVDRARRRARLIARRRHGR